MMQASRLKNYLKFLVKWRLLGVARAFLFSLCKHRPHTAGWEERVLVVNLHALGDVVAMTSVLRRYKMDLPHKKIFCLFSKDIGVTEKLFGEFADHLVLVDLKKFGLNPFYELEFVNKLRDIGFQTVVNQGYGLFELPGKIISVNIGAQNVIGYEGLIIEHVTADWVMRRRISFIKNSLFPRYTKLVPIVDRDFKARGRVTSFPLVYAAIYEAFLEHAPKIMPTKIGIDEDAERSVRERLNRAGVAVGTYGVFVIGGRTPARWWPVAKFSAVAKEVNRLGVPVVLIGTRSEKEAIARLKELANVPVVDLVGELSVAELISVIDHCLFVLTNDTAPVHLAIALKKPSVCIMGLGIFGVSDHYGYPRVNRWVWEKADCFFDYWQCIETAKPGEPAPCIAAVTAEKVISAVRALIALTKGNSANALTKDDDFEPEFESSS